jgi:hypothetical protein
MLASVAASVALGWWFRRSPAPIPIAVLPLDNLSQDPRQQLLLQRPHRRDYPKPIYYRGAGGAFTDVIICP